MKIMNITNQNDIEISTPEKIDVRIPNTKLTKRDTYVLIDGMNVALSRNDNKKARLGDILKTINKLEGKYDNIETYVDASLRHRIDDLKSLDLLVRSGKIYLCPAGITADELIWQRALSLLEDGEETTIVTNDMFPVKGYSSETQRIRNLTVAIINGSNVYLIERDIALLHTKYKNSTKKKWVQ